MTETLVSSQFVIPFFKITLGTSAKFSAKAGELMVRQKTSLGAKKPKETHSITKSLFYYDCATIKRFIGLGFLGFKGLSLKPLGREVRCHHLSPSLEFVLLGERELCCLEFEQE